MKYFLFNSLFNDAFSNSDYIASNEGTKVNNELVRMRKEAVVACFKTPYRHLPGETYENHEKPVRIPGLQVET
jgi:hypothetical protein